MARSRTFGAVPRESVLVRIQATRDGKAVRTQSYRVAGATLDAVCGVIESALEASFGRGSAESDEEEVSAPPLTRKADLARRLSDGISSIEQLIERVREIKSEDDFQRFTAQIRKKVPIPAKKSVGALTGRPVMNFQNWLYDENATWRLTDLQLLAVMRTEFPLNKGQVFTGDVSKGLGHIASIRADYNRTGHGGVPPSLRGRPPSVSYGRVSPDAD